MAEVALGLNADGSVTHYNTWEQMGQGGDIGTLTHTVEALRPLGIKPENVRLELNDTVLAPIPARQQQAAAIIWQDVPPSTQRIRTYP